jgi:hypothetical protein
LIEVLRESIDRLFYGGDGIAVRLRLWIHGFRQPTAQARACKCS